MWYDTSLQGKLCVFIQSKVVTYYCVLLHVLYDKSTREVVCVYSVPSKVFGCFFNTKYCKFSYTVLLCPATRALLQVYKMCMYIKSKVGTYVLVCPVTCALLEFYKGSGMCSFNQKFLHTIVFTRALLL